MFNLTLPLVVVLSVSVGDTSNAVRRVTVKEAVDIVTGDRPHVRAARARLAASLAAAHSQRGRLLPSIHISDAQSWYKTSFGIATTLVPAADLGMLKNFPDDLSMNMLTVAASQPLLGLLHISQDYMSNSDAADAAEADVRASEADVRAKMQTYFLQLFEARAVADTAAASQHNLEEQVGVAQKKVDAGSLTTADVLRLQVAAAKARQQVIAAKAQEATLRAVILELLGLVQEDKSVEFVEPTELQDPPPPADLPQARADALRQRPELTSAKLQAAAAQHHATAKTLALLPEISADASLIHARLDPFNNTYYRGSINVNAANVGVKASWAIWEWGAAWYEREQAQAQADNVAAQYEDAQEQVGGEVASRHSEAIAAASQVEVAKSQVASAEEAFRVMQALSQAGAATTTDLLDAEAAFTEARLSLVRARYEAAIASVSLRRATGS